MSDTEHVEQQVKRTLEKYVDQPLTEDLRKKLALEIESRLANLVGPLIPKATVLCDSNGNMVINEDGSITVQVDWSSTSF